MTGLGGCRSKTYTYYDLIQIIKQLPNEFTHHDVTELLVKIYGNKVKCGSQSSLKALCTIRKIDGVHIKFTGKYANTRSGGLKLNKIYRWSTESFK